MNVVVTGVGWTGRGQLGTALAEGLRGRFIRGTDLWPGDSAAMTQSVEMPSEEELNDWFDAIGFKLALRGGGTIVSCPALRLIHRERIRAACFGDVTFVLLNGSRNTIERRMIAAGMPQTAGRQVLERQFAALDAPRAEPDLIMADIGMPVRGIVADVSAHLLAQKSGIDGPDRQVA